MCVWVSEWVSVHYLLHHWISWSSWQLLPGLQSPAPRPDLHGRHKQTDRHCLARAKQTLTSHQHWIIWGTFYARSALSTCDGSVHPRHRTLYPAVHLISKNQEEVQTPDNDIREKAMILYHILHTLYIALLRQTLRGKSSFKLTWNMPLCLFHLVYHVFIPYYCWAFNDLLLCFNIYNRKHIWMKSVHC